MAGKAPLKQTFSALLAGRAGIVARVASTLSPRFRLGIAARLALSFLAVAVLAVVANLVAGQGTWVVENTRTVAVPQAAPLPAAVSIAPVPVRDETPAAPVEPAADRREQSVTSDALLLAINRHEQAAQARAEADSEETGLRLSAAVDDLDRAAVEYASQVTAVTGVRPRRVVSDVRAYRDLAQALVQGADLQREANAEYVGHFESLNGRMKASLDGAWKIFGRVVARQSLMHLRANLDDIRRDYAAFSGGNDAEQSAAALQASESAFENTLNQGDKGYQRSEGTEWVQQVREDFDALVALRTRLTELRARRDEQARQFHEAAVALTAGIPRRVSAPAARPALKPVVPVPVPAAAAEAAVAPTAAPLAPLAAGAETVTTSKSLAVDHGRRTAMAWITAGVLLVLLVISVMTIRSVLTPVKRMLAASSAIARGDLQARVPRGGVRELDNLAVSFNAMADTLAATHAAAQSVQQQLESKVEERTRQLQDLAEHDPLTRLPNRRQLFALLHEALARAEQMRRNVGVFFLDVDNFKHLNDSLGHAYGDRVLVAVAERLQDLGPAVGIAGRLGGDEFIVLADADSHVDVQMAGERLVGAFRGPLLVDGREVVVTISVGACIYPAHGRYAEELLTAADAALYRAKALGRNQMALYTPELLAAAANRFATEQRLRGAIDRGEFELLYQPEVNVETAEVGLLEALIRWRAPDGRLLPPGDFLAIAEESGLIVEISDWVLRTAIDAAARWHHGDWPDVRVAINASARQLLDPNFVGRLKELLDGARLPARCIEIELTETVLQTAPGTIETLTRLRDLGVAVALDDFGTGYSSLASLEVLPLARIKLDRSVICAIDRSARAAAIAGAIIRLCSGLGLEVTAEGVERSDQIERLRGHRNMFLQGFLLAGPVLREEVASLRASLPVRMRELLVSSPSDYGSNVVDISSVA